MSTGPSFRVVTHFLKSDLPSRLLTCHPFVLSEYRLVALVSTNLPSEMMVTSGRMTLKSGPWNPDSLPWCGATRTCVPPIASTNFPSLRSSLQDGGSLSPGMRNFTPA